MEEDQPITWEQIRLVSSRFFPSGPTQDESVLSIYLDLPPEVRHERRRWQITLNSGMRKLRSRYRDDRELERLTGEVSEQLLKLNPEVRVHNLVCFASPGGWQWARTLHVSTGSQFGWGRLPVLQPLVHTVRSSPKTGVVVLAQHKARLMTWHQGLLGEETVLEADLDTGDWRRYAGGAVATTPQQSATHADDFQARFEEQVERFVRSLAAQVTSLDQKCGWELLLTVAPPRLAEELAASLRQSFRNRLLPNGDANMAKADAEFLAARVESAVNQWNIGRQRREASEALELAMSRGAAAAGPADCLNLLAQDRVQHLMYDSRMRLTGYRRLEGRYILYPDPQNPQPRASDDVLEWAIAACLSTGALVTPLVSEAAQELSSVGGMVATLRYLTAGPRSQYPQFPRPAPSCRRRPG